MNHVSAQAQIVRQVRRFGPVGPVYEVIGLGQVDQSGEQGLKVQLVENGEEVAYQIG